MPATIEWTEIALRLALSVLAGGLLGLNRTERGMTAGLRTTLLVSLAAAVSMIQVNLLLDSKGRAPDSFIMMDLMRLPLGVLTGMGFIGGGAILRRGDRVAGVTTAATLWLATILGLCFGGGQHGLGLGALGLGALILWGLKRLELQLKQDRRGTLMVRIGEGGPTDAEVRVALESVGCRIASWDVTYIRDGDTLRRKICGEVHWQGTGTENQTPPFVGQLAERPGVLALRWKAG